MSVYNINGIAINDTYNISGNNTSSLYDVNGNSLDGDIPVNPLTWNMSEEYKAQVLDALDYIKTYEQNNPSAFALCQFNDVHTIFSGNEPNFIDYNKGYKVIDRMLFAGDMVNSQGATAYANAVAFMKGASASKRLVAMGNHEYGSYTGSEGDPETIYKTVINVDCNYMNDNVLIYYHDDVAHNVRFIALDYFYITKTLADNGHYLDATQLNWLADVLEDSADMDIIIFAHSMINPFYFVSTGSQGQSSATIDDQEDLKDVINAFINRSTYSVVVDGITNTHDFSDCTGDFIMYTSGHYHALGHNDFGFHMFTCPTLQTAYGTGQKKGFVFFIINPTTKAIKVIMCSSEFVDYTSYDYTYQ